MPKTFLYSNSKGVLYEQKQINDEHKFAVFAANAGLIATGDIDVTAREIDFVTSFERNWEALREILGIQEQLKKIRELFLKANMQKER